MQYCKCMPTSHNPHHRVPSRKLRSDLASTEKKCRKSEYFEQRCAKLEQENMEKDQRLLDMQRVLSAYGATPGAQVTQDMLQGINDI